MSPPRPLWADHSQCERPRYFRTPRAEPAKKWAGAEVSVPARTVIFMAQGDVRGGGPRRVNLVRPLGDRSCNTGGTWESCHSANIDGEERAISTISRSDNDARLLRREMKTRLELAVNGRLNYGKDLDVYCCDVADLVLELRFDTRVQYPDGVRAVRLYFSEPDSEPGLLLAARLAAKPATVQGLSLQDEHMREAQLRVERHFGL